MQEYVAEAVVLDKETNGDLDSRVVFFTKQFGKLSAKAKSARKITSKLSAHLEPGNVSKIRLVEKNGLQVVDALKESRLEIGLPDLCFLKELLAEAEPEPAVWESLVGGRFSRKEVLKNLGWDPDFAACALCGKDAAVFHLKSQDFFCKACSFKAAPGDVVYI